MSIPAGAKGRSLQLQRLIATPSSSTGAWRSCDGKGRRGAARLMRGVCRSMREASPSHDVCVHSKTKCILQYTTPVLFGHALLETFVCNDLNGRREAARSIRSDGALDVHNSLSVEGTGAPRRRQRLNKCVLSPWASFGILTALLTSLMSVRGMRGPHHPRGEVVKHTHYRPEPEHRTKLTHDTQLLQDAEHIREDLGEWATNDVMERMSPGELEFHYFKLHDLDNNTKLDGLEILRAIQHADEHDEDGEHKQEEEFEEQEREDRFPYYVDLIDQVLSEDDKDNDGYLSYTEYVLGRQRDRETAVNIIQKPT